jgi:uncharacterized damage-inducible protein DinB
MFRRWQQRPRDRARLERTTAMTDRQTLIEVMEFTRGITLETFNDIDPEKRFFQPAPGVNHALWLLGHIAVSQNHLVADFCLGESMLPGEYGKLFGMKSELLEDPSGYPAAEELLEAMAKVHAASVAYARDASDDQLAQLPVGHENLPEHAQGMFTSRGKCLWFSVTHESIHAGQLGTIRRMLGKPYRV